MYKLIGSDMNKAIILFSEYTHNTAVFMSALQEIDSKWGAMYVDNPVCSNWAVIYTPNMYFVAGDVKVAGLREQLEKLLFETLIEMEPESDKEMSVFSPSPEWYPVLDTIFLPKKGFAIPRRQFSFDEDRFLEWVKALGTLPEGYEIRFFDAQTAASNPVISTIWTNPLRFVEMSAGASLYVDGCCVSTCIAPMTGGGYAEIDIETHEACRGRGYAPIVATAVINVLLGKGLRPSWSTWPNREASQIVARKLGFIPMPDVPAYHWNKYECLPYEGAL